MSGFESQNSTLEGPRTWCLDFGDGFINRALLGPNYEDALVAVRLL